MPFGTASAKSCRESSAYDCHSGPQAASEKDAGVGHLKNYFTTCPGKLRNLLGEGVMHAYGDAIKRGESVNAAVSSAVEFWAGRVGNEEVGAAVAKIRSEVELQPVTPQMLEFVALNITKKYLLYSLGLQLGLQECEIKTCITEGEGDISEAAYEMLKFWLDRCGNDEGSGHKLRQALADSKLSSIIEKCRMGSVPSPTKGTEDSNALTDKLLLKVAGDIDSPEKVQKLGLELGVRHNDTALICNMENDPRMAAFMVFSQWRESSGSDDNTPVKQALVNSRLSGTIAKCGMGTPPPLTAYPAVKRDNVTDKGPVCRSLSSISILDLSKEFTHMDQVFELAIALGMEEENICAITHSYGRDSRGAVYDILSIWKERYESDEEACVALKQALVDSGQENIIEACNMGEAPSPSIGSTVMPGNITEEPASETLTGVLMLKVAHRFASMNMLEDVALLLGMEEEVIQDTIDRNRRNVPGAAYGILVTWHDSQSNDKEAHDNLKQALVNSNNANIIEACKMGILPSLSVNSTDTVKNRGQASSTVNDWLLLQVSRRIRSRRALRFLAYALGVDNNSVCSAIGSGNSVRDAAYNVLTGWYQSQPDNKEAHDNLKQALVDSGNANTIEACNMGDSPEPSQSSPYR